MVVFRAGLPRGLRQEVWFLAAQCRWWCGNVNDTLKQEAAACAWPGCCLLPLQLQLQNIGGEWGSWWGWGLGQHHGESWRWSLHLCLFPSGPFLIWGCSSALSSSWAEPSSARSLSSTALSSGCLPRASAADLWSKPQELGAFLLCQLPTGVLSEEMLSWEVGL